MGAWFAVYYLPVIRFAVSDEWATNIWWIAVPGLWLVAILSALAKSTFIDEYDAFLIDRWKRKGGQGVPPSIRESSPIKTAGALLGMIVAMRLCAVSILLTWVPMASTLFSREPIEHAYTVEALNESNRGPDVIEFVGHYFMMSGVPYPPDDIWNAAKPGDTIRLSGTGNDWGVFYDEVELIKQE